MTVIKSGALEAFLRKPTAGIAAIMIYGDDQPAIHDLARQAVAKLAGSVDDPFAVAWLDESLLAGNPGRLADEVQSQSLLGGRRVVWVRGAEQAFLRSVEPVLSGALSGNLIIAEAGSLAKGSALRAGFEDSKHAYVLPLYESSASDLKEVARTALSRQGFRIDEEALDLLVESAGAGRPVMLREAEKLALYCTGKTEVLPADVLAVCGNASGLETDDLVDAVFAGDIGAADRAYRALRDGGVDGARMLSVAHAHAIRLIELRQSIERGGSADHAVRSARPPIFFKRQGPIRSQLVHWRLEALLAAAATLAGAVAQTRLSPGLADSLANRALLSVARNAQSDRLRIN